jgi:hypothetical protein
MSLRTKPSRPVHAAKTSPLRAWYSEEESHTLQGINETSTFERQKKHGRWEGPLKHVTYYEFIAVMDRVRTKVIVKQVEGEESYFYSLIPFWRVSEITKKRLLHDGNSEED